MKACTPTLWLLLVAVNIAACSDEYGALKKAQANNKGNSADASSVLTVADDATPTDACALASIPASTVCTSGSFTCQDPATQPVLSATGSCSVALVQQQLFAQACKAGTAIVPSQVSCIADTNPVLMPLPVSKDPTSQPTAPTTIPSPPSGDNPACASANAPTSFVCQAGSITCTGGGLTVTGKCSDGIVSRQLFAKACSQGVTLTPEMVTCDDSGLDPVGPVLPIDVGGPSCGPIPADIAFTAEQTICCNNGKWVTQLGHEFGGPATCGGQ